MAVRRVRWFVRLRRWAATAIVLAITAVAVALIYQYYVTSPWTRDGRVRVLVASVAPQVSGQIVQLNVVDNQSVKKGDVLYVIDPFDYKIKVDSSKSVAKSRAADLQVKQTEAKRREALTSLSTSVEEKQRYAGTAAMAEADFAEAQVQLAQAEVNLKRTSVRSPVEGFITNLTLRVGDYASTSTSNISIVDASSFWVDGYFEETKLARICVGDVARVELMGFAQPIHGKVASIGRGISVSDAAISTQGLPNVNPVYTWVRLAQRVPIRIALTDVPKDIPLVSGLTATVRIHKTGEDEDSVWPRIEQAQDSLLVFFRLRPPPRRACAEPDNGSTGDITKLPIDKAQHPLSPEELLPGLAPSMNKAPLSKP